MRIIHSTVASASSLHNSAFMAIDDSSSTTTRLLTLLNVSATKAGKRKRTYEESKPVEKLNKKRAVVVAPVLEHSTNTPEPSSTAEENEDNMQVDAEGEAEEEDSAGARRIILL